MTHLKAESMRKCFSLLREYIGENPKDTGKRIATLALNQLEKITAGSRDKIYSIDAEPDIGLSCIGHPRANGSSAIKPEYNDDSAKDIPSINIDRLS